MRVDAIRDEIDRLGLAPVERGLLLTSLLEAADRVDSTCGLQMAYVKQLGAALLQRARAARAGGRRRARRGG